MPPGGHAELGRGGAAGAVELDEGLGRPAHGGRVDDRGEPLDHPARSKAVDTSLDRRGGEGDLGADLGVRRARIRHEQRNDSLVDGVHLQ
jgi:hypothetical protein